MRPPFWRARASACPSCRLQRCLIRNGKTTSMFSRTLTTRSVSPLIFRRMHTTPLQPRPIHWILDFDGTITQRDTLDALVNIAATQKPTANVPHVWKNIVQAYLSDYDATLKHLLPDGERPTDVPGERVLLSQLKAVEQRSLERVCASGIFTGLTREAMRAGAADAVAKGSVQARSGLQDFLRALKDRIQQQMGTQDVVDVLSVNWSQRFIAGCLAALCPEVDLRTPSKPSEYQNIEKTTNVANGQAITLPAAKQPDADLIVNVYANELEGLSSNSPSTGIIAAKGEHKIISSPDKLVYMLGNRKENPHTTELIPVVYIGDSGTDIECLLEADLGICIRDVPMTSSQKQVKETLERLGIECPHISEHREGIEGRWDVAWAKNFGEIKRWLGCKE